MSRVAYALAVLVLLDVFWETLVVVAVGLCAVVVVGLVAVLGARCLLVWWRGW